jgi:hypothetical protein
MPVRIRCWGSAGGVQSGHLFGSETPTDRAEILLKLFFVACANDYRGHARSLKQPVSGDLRDRFIRLECDFIQSINNAKEVFVIHLRTGVRGNFRVQAALFRSRLAAPDFPG